MVNERYFIKNKNKDFFLIGSQSTPIIRLGLAIELTRKTCQSNVRLPNGRQLNHNRTFNYLLTVTSFIFLGHFSVYSVIILKWKGWLFLRIWAKPNRIRFNWFDNWTHTKLNVQLCSVSKPNRTPIVRLVFSSILGWLVQNKNCKFLFSFPLTLWLLDEVNMKKI